MSIVLGIGTFLLIIISLFMVLVVLAQKAKSDGGMGSAMGGGMAEAAFGADTGNVLSKATINAAVAFFVLTFALYLGRIYERKHAALASGSALPTIAVPAAVGPKPGVGLPMTAPLSNLPATNGVPASLARPVSAPATLPGATTNLSVAPGSSLPPAASSPTPTP